MLALSAVCASGWSLLYLLLPRRGDSSFVRKIFTTRDSHLSSGTGFLRIVIRSVKPAAAGPVISITCSIGIAHSVPRKAREPWSRPVPLRHWGSGSGTSHGAGSFIFVE